MIEAGNRDCRHGLLINITGNGKGKTTSGLGTCLRALGWGWKVAVIQFVKANQDTGEKHFADQTTLPLAMFTLGGGLSRTLPPEGLSHQDCAVRAFKLAADYLTNEKVDLLMLDELNVAMSKGWLETTEVVAALQRRSKWLHVIVTGRGAPPELIAVSDLVSKIQAVKHPYQSGIPAQPGIDF